MIWQLADAKNRFSEVVTKALTEGPQRVRRRGQTVVVISEDEYNRLTGEKSSFIEFILNGPGFEGVDVERDQSLPREFEW